MKSFLLDSRDPEKASYLWNMVACILYAAQSPLMLIVVTWALGVAEAGIFSLAYANSYLVLAVGLYGMRKFQASDMERHYSFHEYRDSRFLTTGIMLAAAALMILVLAARNEYSFHKGAVLLLMCVFRAVDAVEDVYYGGYQQNSRLDIASRASALRTLATTVFFVAAVAFTRDLPVSLIGATILTAAIFVALTRLTIYEVVPADEKKSSRGNVFRLLLACLPLCVGGLATIYITNAPKYAIDAVLNDEAQAYYTFLSMPVFVISLLSGFLYNPQIVRASAIWQTQGAGRFVKYLMRQTLVIMGVAAACLGIGYFLGLPVLSWLYHADLSGYLPEFLILLVAGGLNALVGYFIIIVTIIRFQNSLLIGYAAVAALAFFLCPAWVGSGGVRGAAESCLLLSAGLFVAFAAAVAIGILRRRPVRSQARN